MTGARPHLALRRALLAVTVCHDIDVLPSDDGIVLAEPARLVTWSQCYAALADIAPEHPDAIGRLAATLRLVRVVDGLPGLLLADSARVVGLPVGHPVNPGLSWVVERVHGDALDLGLGILGLDGEHPRRVVVVPPVVFEIVGADPLRWWRGARRRLEEMGAVAVERLSREPDALRPVGDADAITLLGSSRLRGALAARDGGMATIAVPMRRRGWTRLSLLDPAFTPAAAMATDPADRGFVRPIMVTAHEVALAGDGTWAREAAIDGRLHAADAMPLHRR